jgi:hypothetical protein
LIFLRNIGHASQAQEDLGAGAVIALRSRERTIPPTFCSSRGVKTQPGSS